MALSNAERQKRWMEKNRALHNLRRRKKSGGGESVTRAEVAAVRDNRVSSGGAEESGDNPPSSLPFQTKRVGEFRMIVMPEEDGHSESVMPVVKPKVFLNDHGVPIPEGVWKRLQEEKRKAKDAGWEFDPQ